MNVAMFVSGIVAWLLLTTLTCHAASENHNIGLLDSVTNLVEHVSKLSDQLARQSNQLSKLSDNQAKQSDQLARQSDQLSKLSDNQAELTDQQDKLSDTQTEHQSEMTNRLDTLEERKIRDDVTKMDVLNQIMELENKISSTSAGPTFIRWGRTSCNGTNSEMIYSGTAAGTRDEHQGGAANLLCLPIDPTYGNHDDSDHWGVDVSVAEYYLDIDDNFPFEHNDPLLRDKFVACAVCEVTNGSSVMMIPARVDCYSDWKMEYRGYLMSEKWETYRTEFVCVDANPEADSSGGESAYYKTGLYPAEGWCDYLSPNCPPYGHSWELACVVCSK